MKSHEQYYQEQYRLGMLKWALVAGIELNDKVKEPRKLTIRTSLGLFDFNGRFFELHGNREIKIPFGKEFDDWRKNVEAELKIADLINETLDNQSITQTF
jgi:hypothetical protein